MKPEHNILQTVAFLLAIILLFSLMGSGDYADELELENARLRTQLKVAAAHCSSARHLIALRQVQP